jgi:hypothetical protein
MFVIIGCEKTIITKDELNSIVNRNVSINYTLNNSPRVIKNNMVNKGAIDDYKAFYNKYIVGRILTPKLYSLTFTGINTHSITSIVSEKWSDKRILTLPEEKYIVTGYSKPKCQSFSLSGDTCYFSFNDTIEITQNTTEITLKAIYDCSLILFDTTNIDFIGVGLSNAIEETTLDPNIRISTFEGWYCKPTLLKTENFYHLFLFNNDAWKANKGNLIMSIVKYRGTTVMNVQLGTYSFVPAYYYYFADTNGDYILPPMSPSN